MQNVTGRPAVNLLAGNADGMGRQMTKRGRLIQQYHVNTPFVRRLGNGKVIAGITQRRVLHQILYAVFVLHFAQSHQIRNLLVSRRQDHFGYFSQLVIIAGLRPSSWAVRLKLIIVLQGVMAAVKQILHIIFHHPELVLSLGRG